jgi:hypothetical protein
MGTYGFPTIRAFFIFQTYRIFAVKLLPDGEARPPCEPFRGADFPANPRGAVQPFQSENAL